MAGLRNFTLPAVSRPEWCIFASLLPGLVSFMLRRAAK